MIERTESEAAGFVCPFSRNAAQHELQNASRCIGSRCMLWVPGEDSGEIVRVTHQQLAARFTPPAHNPLDDRDERIKAMIAAIREAATAFVSAQMPGRQVVKVHPTGDLDRPGATVVLASRGVPGHCGVMR